MLFTNDYRFDMRFGIRFSKLISQILCYFMLLLTQRELEELFSVFNWEYILADNPVVNL